MKKITLSLVMITIAVLIFGFSENAFSQKPTMELTFTAENNGQYVPLDSIFIENLTQGGDTTLYVPDTILVIDYVTSIGDNRAIWKNTLSVAQNYPNPFKGKTEVNLYLPESDDIKITVRDILGRELAHYENTLNRGNHTFSFYPGNETYYLLTVSGKQTRQTIKMLNAGSTTTNGEKCKLVYTGNKGNVSGFKSQKAINDFGFSLGDELKYTAYSDLGERTITDSPTGDQTYTFQYASGIPCPGMPTVNDIEGNVYNTVQIGNQCWMAENLKTTTYNNGTAIPNVTDEIAWSNLSTGAYVWYDNDISWKDLYGALYNWYAVADANGLCPTGWYVPTDDEWTDLTDFIGGTNEPHGNELKSCRQVNSPLGGGCNTTEHPRWDENSTHWGTDDYGFSGLPGGTRATNGAFLNFGGNGDWWSSTEYSSYDAWGRLLGYYGGGFVYVDYFNKQAGFSVRCLRDETTTSIPNVETGSVSNITTNSADIEGEIIDIGGSDILQHGHCWSTELNPSVNDFKTELGSTSNTGTFTSNLTELEPATNYYVKAYATNSDGTAYGEEVSFETDAGSCPSTVTDIDGNVYNTVQIGNQCWMAENLKTTTYNNGTAIPNVTDEIAWGNLTTGAYVWYDNDITWKGPYGALYNWYATVEANGLCPTGWHVPTNDEWTVLTDFIGGIAPPHGNELKSCRQVNSPLGGGCNTTEHPRWNENSTHWGTDDYGFSCLPGGNRYNYGVFYNIGDYGYWWSSTETASNFAWYRNLSYDFGYVSVDDYFKQSGYSVRCLKD